MDKRDVGAGAPYLCEQNADFQSARDNDVLVHF